MVRARIYSPAGIILSWRRAGMLARVLPLVGESVWHAHSYGFRFVSSEAERAGRVRDRGQMRLNFVDDKSGP